MEMTRSLSAAHSEMSNVFNCMTTLRRLKAKGPGGGNRLPQDSSARMGTDTRFTGWHLTVQRATTHHCAPAEWACWQGQIHLRSSSKPKGPFPCSQGQDKGKSQETCPSHFKETRYLYISLLHYSEYQNLHLNLIGSVRWPQMSREQNVQAGAATHPRSKDPSA